MERYHIFKLGLAILFYAVYCIRPMVVNGQKIDDDDNQTKKFREEDLVFYQGVEGKPGVDFPILSHIPRTSFSCRDVESGYYADLETDCQVFHICEDNKKISFLCPNGTIFQQSELICEWWFKVNCTNSPNLYEESAEQLREENAKRKLSRRVQSHGAVMRTEQRSSVSKKASKRVFIDNGRRENRIDNHASTYRDDLEQNNDLSRSPSSDFRDGNINSVGERNEESHQSRQNQRGRKPVQFRQPPSVDNERNEERKPVPSTSPGTTTQRFNGRKPNVDNAESNYQQENGRQDFGLNQPPRRQQGTKKQSQSRNDYNQQNSNERNENQQRRPNNQNQSNGDTVNNDFQQRNEPTFGSRNQAGRSKSLDDQNERFHSEPILNNNFQQKSSIDYQNQGSGNVNNDFPQGPSNSANGEQNKFQTNYDNQNDRFSSNLETSTSVPNHHNHDNKAFNSENKQLENNDFRNNVPSANQNSFTINFETSTLAPNNYNSRTTSFRSNNRDEQNNQRNLPAENQNSKYTSNFESTTSAPNNYNSRKEFNSPSGNQNKFTSSFETSSQPSNHFNNDFQSRQPFDNDNRSGFDSGVKESNAVSAQNSRSNEDLKEINNKNDNFYSNNQNQKPDSSFQQQSFNNEKNNNNENEPVQSLNTNTEEPGSYRQDRKYLPESGNANDRQDFGVSTTQKSIPFSNLSQNGGRTDYNLNNAFNSGFPNKNQEAAFSTGSQQAKSFSVENKDGSVKQKSTVPLTKNDIVNRRLESGESDEAQITQETASFYKNSFNKIDQERKYYSPNTHPNHRETYSELKEPRYYSTKLYSAISSVTPQYLTTQPINNGKPFIGSQVGTSLRNLVNATTPGYFSTTTSPTLFNFSKTDRTGNPSTTIQSNLFNSRRTEQPLRPLPLSTLSPVTPRPTFDDTSPGSFSTGGNTFRPRHETSTGKVIDHATVYGKFVKSSATTPPSGKTTIVLSKSVSNGNGLVSTPFTAPATQATKLYSTIPTSGNKIISLSRSLFGGGGVTPTAFSKPTQGVTSAEILSASDSFNRGTPQVRFYGKVQSNTKVPGVQIHFNGNPASTSSSGFNSFSTTAKPFNSKDFGAKFEPSSTAIPLLVNNLSHSASPIGGDSTIPRAFSPLSTTISPEFTPSVSTFSPAFHSRTPTSNTFFSSTINPEINSVTPTSFNTFSTISHEYNTDTTTTRPFAPSQAKTSGFFVTKNSENVAPTQRSRISDIVRPRPFQLPPEPDFGGKAVYSPNIVGSTLIPTYPTYKISSASPFAEPSTPEPTTPTPFTTATPTLPSTFENVDSMINALAEMATSNNFSDNPRPGLVIPPSAGPQTLHTLAVYFANALDGIASDKEEEEGEEEDEENLSKPEMEKKKLTELLTQMTMDRYNELFNEDREHDQETSTISSRSKFGDDLEGQHSKGPIQETPKVRQLAKVFTQALSSYLDDPATFRKVLQEVRPTEPPELDHEEATDFGDDELLNFSDADSKSSYPPFFSTPSPARPTWGYLITYNTSQNLDVKNSINTDLENLQGADSQSFVSQFNKLQNAFKDSKETTTKSSIQLPLDHWTSSPDVDKLWKTAFAFDPASINENFGTTEVTKTTTEETDELQPTEDTHHDKSEEEEHHEVKYELRALPNLELNSTQVHGILIDFMNTTKSDGDNRLQRILRKLNTTQDEFIAKMKEIENNPLTRRLILLLINECGNNSTQQVLPVETLLNHSAKSSEILETSSSVAGFGAHQEVKKSTSGLEIVDPNLGGDNQDSRALQLLNSLYTIASKFGK